MREQSDDQMAFRRLRGVHEAFVVLEAMARKSLEWNLPLWIVSLDLTKASDEIECDSLFAADCCQQWLNKGGRPHTFGC